MVSPFGVLPLGVLPFWAEEKSLVSLIRACHLGTGLTTEDHLPPASKLQREATPCRLSDRLQPRLLPLRL